MLAAARRAGMAQEQRLRLLPPLRQAHSTPSSRMDVSWMPHSWGSVPVLQAHTRERAGATQER